MPFSWKDLEEHYGKPETQDFLIEFSDAEFDTLLASTHRARYQDATVLIFNESGQVACIRKHSYPEGIFRPPSGLINRDEGPDQAAVREAHEETGLEIELERYLLRASVHFKTNDRILLWTTHVFRCRPTASQLEPINLEEIAEARWLSLGELRRMSDPMRRSGRGGLVYRAHLMDRLLKHADFLTAPYEKDSIH